MPATQLAPDLATRSQIVKRLFPIYHLFTERFGLPEPPISDARALKANTDVAVITSTEMWMDELDRKIDAFQVRSVVQSSNVGASELRILALLERLLAKPNPDNADRSKIDFLLAQLLATRLSLHSEHTPTLAEVAEVLEPVTGKADTVNSIPALETLITDLLAAQRLRDIKQKSIIERGREAKNELGNNSLRPENLVACSRFNFLLRKRCFELMKEEVKLTQAGLKRLSDRGVHTLDCTAAKMAGAENIEGLMEICRTWQERKADDYAHDNPFSQVLALQEIVERAAESIDGEPTGRRASHDVLKQVDEPLRPTPDVIQIYAELATLRREHQQLSERVEQQGIRMVELRRAEEEQRIQLASLRAENERLKAAPAHNPVDATTTEEVPFVVSAGVPEEAPIQEAPIQETPAQEIHVVSPRSKACCTRGCSACSRSARTKYAGDLPVTGAAHGTASRSAGGGKGQCPQGSTHAPEVESRFHHADRLGNTGVLESLFTSR